MTLNKNLGIVFPREIKQTEKINLKLTWKALLICGT